MAACTHTHTQFCIFPRLCWTPEPGQQPLGGGERVAQHCAGEPGRTRRGIRPPAPSPRQTEPAPRPPLPTRRPGGGQRGAGGAEGVPGRSRRLGSPRRSSARPGPPGPALLPEPPPPAPSPGPPRRARSFFAFSFFFLLFLFIFFNPSRGAAAGAGGAGNSRSERRAGRPWDGSVGAAVPPAPQSFPVNMVIPSAFLSARLPSLPAAPAPGGQRGWGRGGCKSGV